MKNNKGFAPIATVLIIIAVLAVGGIAYYVGTKNTSAPENADASVLGYITSDQVGPFQIGGPIPDQALLLQAGYSVRETTIFPEGMPTKQFIVSRDGKDLLTFRLYPSSIGSVDVLVEDIRVTSSGFKTKEEIGVDSTVFDFIKAYPNYKFWYSQEEGEKFVLNTSSDKENLQFFLDRSGLLSPDKSFYPTRATISDFKTDAKIVSVRVY